MDENPYQSPQAMPPRRRFNVQLWFKRSVAVISVVFGSATLVFHGPLAEMLADIGWGDRSGFVRNLLWIAGGVFVGLGFKLWRGEIGED